MSSIMTFLIKFEGPSLFGRDSDEVSVDSVSKGTLLYSPSLTKAPNDSCELIPPVQFTKDDEQDHLAG